MISTPEEIVARFFDAVEREDADAVAELYADDIYIWHSNTGLTQTKAENVARIASFKQLGQFRYHILSRIADGPDVAQHHRLEVRSRDGERQASLHAAMIFEIRNDKIVAFHEYFDGREAEELRRKLVQG